MQTFLPYANFTESAKVLDRHRLGKQRVETLQILHAIVYKTGWRNHPKTKLWSESPGCLVEYGLAICDEWIHRGAQSGSLYAVWIGENMPNLFIEVLWKRSDSELLYRGQMIRAEFAIVRCGACGKGVAVPLINQQCSAACGAFVFEVIVEHELNAQQLYDRKAKVISEF